jgi:hypothetical protein
MPKVKLDLLRAGMMVTADVKNADDMLLIPAGYALTEKQIDMLSAWGIAEIQVQTEDGMDDGGDPLQKLSPETLEKVTRELEAIFWTPVDANPIQKAVFDLVLRRKARQLPGS